MLTRGKKKPEPHMVVCSCLLRDATISWLQQAGSEGSLTGTCAQPRTAAATAGEIQGEATADYFLFCCSQSV